MGNSKNHISAKTRSNHRYYRAFVSFYFRTKLEGSILSGVCTIFDQITKVFWGLHSIGSLKPKTRNISNKNGKSRRKTKKWKSAFFGPFFVLQWDIVKNEYFWVLKLFLRFTVRNPQKMSKMFLTWCECRLWSIRRITLGEVFYRCTHIKIFERFVHRMEIFGLHGGGGKTLTNTVVHRISLFPWGGGKH